MAHTLMTCPSSSSALPAAATRCPLCGHGLAARTDRDYAEKRIAAPLHPLVVLWMTSVVALGWHHEGRAACAPRDLTVHHSARPVRNAASRKLQRQRDGAGDSDELQIQP